MKKLNKKGEDFADAGDLIVSFILILFFFFLAISLSMCTKTAEIKITEAYSKTWESRYILNNFLKQQTIYEDFEITNADLISLYYKKTEILQNSKGEAKKELDNDIKNIKDQISSELHTFFKNLQKEQHDETTFNLNVYENTVYLYSNSNYFSPITFHTTINSFGKDLKVSFIREYELEGDVIW